MTRSPDREGRSAQTTRDLTPDAHDSAPEWFLRAIDQPPEQGSLEVDGCHINVLTWGSPSLPTLVLVHGGAAHANWWSFVAPLLADDHRVVAVDLSGHGDSGHRDRYGFEVWLEEVLAAAAAFGGATRPTVVGHSMGGVVTMLGVARRSDDLDGAIIIDAPMRRPDPETEEARAGAMFRSPKTYPDLETATEHFHLVPPQPTEHAWLLDHVARTSLHRTDRGWTWKFDPRVFTSRSSGTSPDEIAEGFAAARCPVAAIVGARSAIVDEPGREQLAALLRSVPAADGNASLIVVPEAHHHVMFDRPLELVTALRAIAGAWRSS